MKATSDCGPYVCVVPGCETIAMLCRRVCREHNPRPFGGEHDWTCEHGAVRGEGCHEYGCADA